VPAPPPSHTQAEPNKQGTKQVCPQVAVQGKKKKERVEPLCPPPPYPMPSPLLSCAPALLVGTLLPLLLLGQLMQLASLLSHVLGAGAVPGWGGGGAVRGGVGGGRGVGAENARMHWRARVCGAGPLPPSTLTRCRSCPRATLPCTRCIRSDCSAGWGRGGALSAVRNNAQSTVRIRPKVGARKKERKGRGTEEQAGVCGD
jgi:hypothetical protein